ncbi:MAG: hypothetical protein ACREH4_06745 [Vitreimonas sp.]
MIETLSEPATLNAIRACLCLPPGGVDATLIAQVLRRAAFFMAPAPRHELERAVRSSLRPFITDEEVLKQEVNAAFECMATYGDVIEMRDAAGKLRVRPLPPAFIVRHDGALMLTGIAGDEITPTLGEGIDSQHRDTLRLVTGADALAAREAGLIELTETAWLRLPAAVTAQAHVDHWREHLDRAAPTTPIAELKLIDPASPVTFYPDRWRGPRSGDTGTFVARRPQTYGDPLWCAVTMTDGVLTRFVDLYGPGDRERPCDVAWRLQMALDAVNGCPQRFRREDAGDRRLIKFFSPLPGWIERKLAVRGDKMKAERCLYAYAFAASPDDETTFLAERGWLHQDQKD